MWLKNIDDRFQAYDVPIHQPEISPTNEKDS